MEMNNRFLRACRHEPVDATPVWFMRQAGRYMPEYRAIREKYSLLEICYEPELAAEEPPGASDTRLSKPLGAGHKAIAFDRRW